MDLNEPHQIFLPLQQGNRRWILVWAAILIAVVAVVDWRLDVDISFGFLYLFPMLLVGSVLSPWQIAGVAALCTVLVEAFDTFPWSVAIGIPRIFLTFAAFTGGGLYVYESARNRRLASHHLAEVEHEIDLRREAEAQLKVLLESSPAAILTVDSGGSVLWANDAAHRMIGIENGGLTGSAIGRYFPAVNSIPFPRGDSRLFRTSMECTAKRQDGSVFLAQVWFSTYRTSAGPRLAAVVIDASDDLRTREEISMQQLAAGSRILVSAVCHEIRNICGSIAAVHAKLVRSRGGMMDEDFRTLGSLLDGLSRLAGLELRHSKPEAEYIDISAVLEEVRIVIETEFAESGIAIEWRIAEGLPLVWASHQELLHAFLNIAKNSARAMSVSPEKRITVSAVLEKEHVVLRFLDSGPGVANPGLLFKTFQPGAEANGLGLYLSRAFVRSFRGDIHYEPQPAGACFAVALAVAREEQNAENPALAGRRPQPVSREP